MQVEWFMGVSFKNNNKKRNTIEGIKKCNFFIGLLEVMTPFKAVTTCIQEAIAGLFLSEGWAEGESTLERASAEKRTWKSVLKCS